MTKGYSWTYVLNATSDIDKRFPKAISEDEHSLRNYVFMDQLVDRLQEITQVKLAPRVKDFWTQAKEKTTQLEFLFQKSDVLALNSR